MTNERSVTRHPSLLLCVSPVLADADVPIKQLAPSAPIRHVAVYRPVPGAVGSAAVRVGSLPRRLRPEMIRRRRAAILFGVGLLTLTGVGVASAGTNRPGNAKTVVHVVLPGESLWSIARNAKPRGDVRSLVVELGKQMHGDQLQPGDELTVPVSGGS